MLDISHKTSTLRIATAEAVLRLSSATLERVRLGQVPKGDALEVARVAAIQAAKETSRIIPFCHPLPIDYAGVEYILGQAEITITVTVKAIYKTGVEMEALTSASIAALTLYDMLKPLDDSMEITGIRLISKQGGKSGFRDSFPAPLKAAVLVLSDRVAAGEKADSSGKLIRAQLERYGVEVTDYRVVADELSAITAALTEYADVARLDLVFTTGGTGLGPRDVTPDATRQVIEREAPGIAEAIRAYGQERMPYAMLSRGVAGLRGKTLIINLPGAPGAVTDALSAIFPAVLHCLAIRSGGGHGDTYGGGEPERGA